MLNGAPVHLLRHFRVYLGAVYPGRNPPRSGAVYPGCHPPRSLDLNPLD